ncbi:MAG: type III-A CRISPR-associated protein Csm2 [bacterium]|nr:type III-A CRISPR-associated protein Csm2 [bacterium]
MNEDWKDKLAAKTGYKPQPQNVQKKDQPKSSKNSSIQFYADEAKEQIFVELLETKALNWAVSFIHPQISREKLNAAQIRRFHNDVRELEAKIEAAGVTGFNKMLPLVKMMKSKVAYACPSDGRERKVPEEFRSYMETMINSIKDYKDFKAFSLCFEAVVGYFFGEGGR